MSRLGPGLAAGVLWYSNSLDYEPCRLRRSRGAKCTYVAAGLTRVQKDGGEGSAKSTRKLRSHIFTVHVIMTLCSSRAIGTHARNRPHFERRPCNDLFVPLVIMIIEFSLQEQTFLHTAFSRSIIAEDFPLHSTPDKSILCDTHLESAAICCYSSSPPPIRAG